MGEAIGIRLSKGILRQIEKLSKEGMEDRSTVIRKLIMIGYLNLMRKRAAEEYIKGNITLSEAAHQAGLTLWEMERYLVEEGFKSSYSIEDIEKEMKILEDKSK